MSGQKISKNFTLNLFLLLDGQAVNASAFINKTLLRRMVDDRVVARVSTGRNRAVIKCQDPEALRTYLRLHFGISDLEEYVELLGRDVMDGEESLKATASTKMFRTKSMQGFFLKAFGGETVLNGEALKSLPDGGEYFITDFERLEIPGDVLVIGVENPECFQKAGRLLDLFPDEPMVFVLRFYSNRLLDWLESVENRYLHFGDFDPAGIGIYCNEYLKRLGEDRCCFFVPSNIEELIRNGQAELFDRQRRYLPEKEQIDQVELVNLVGIIEKYGKGVEQEVLLRKF